MVTRNVLRIRLHALRSDMVGLDPVRPGYQVLDQIFERIDP